MRKKLNINKTVFTIIFLNIVQISTLLTFIIFGSLLHRGPFISFSLPNENLLLWVSILIILINSILSIRDAFDRTQTSSQYKMLKDSLSQVENLNHTLRAQRHDFMNHLQVVYSLMEMEEFSDARNYIDKVYTDIQKVSSILKTSNTAVNALLQAKILQAEKRDITVRMHITSQIADLSVPSWEMCRVLGNLIDNAMDALTAVETEKIIDVEIFEDLRSYGFRVRDNGPAIDKEILQKIFEPMFTTKGEHGEGMGLAIVKGILSEHKGDIHVTSNTEETVFEVNVPK